MKGASRLAAVVLAVAAFAGSARAEDRRCVVGMAGGVLVSDATYGEILGPSASVWLATPLQAGLLLGAEFGWNQVNANNVHMSWDGDMVGTDRLQSIKVTVMLRAQHPVRRGPSLFVAAGTGIARSSGGDTHISDYGGAQAQVYPGLSATAWTSSMDLGISCVIPGAWPDPEIAIRMVAWVGEQTNRGFGPRLGFVW